MRVVFFLIIVPVLLQGQVWTRLPDFPGIKRDDGVAVVVNNTAYFGTGLIEWNATIDFYALDLYTHQWTSIPGLPNTTERQYACAFAGPGCFYVFGGDGVGGALNNMYKYDIASSTWTAVASKPGNGLVGASCMSFGNKVILCGGKYQDGSASAEVWEYSISTDSWQQKNNVSFTPRWRASAAVLNNMGYLVFGRDLNGAYRKELYRYDPLADSWIKLADFPLSYGRAYAAMHAVNTTLTIFGGQDTLGHYYKDTWYYKEASNSWLQGPDLPAAGRRGGMSCSWEEELFYTCGLGEGDQRLTETWKTDVPVSLSENYNNSTWFRLSPNPCNNFITISCRAQNGQTLSCRYYDLCGNLLGEKSGLKEEDRIDLKDLPAGLYLFKLYQDQVPVSVKRIIKNN